VKIFRGEHRRRGDGDGRAASGGGMMTKRTSVKLARWRELSYEGCLSAAAFILGMAKDRQ